MKKLFLLMMLPTISFAQISEKTFEEIWQNFYQKSLSQKSVAKEQEANELSLARAKRHWIPRAYVTGQWFNTNDPTAVFFNHLGQRAITQADFNPSDLNRPGQKTFQTAGLGIDFPIFEGGLKSSQTSMYESLVKSSEIELKAKKTEEYSELTRQYGGLKIYSANQSLLSDLKNDLKAIIKNYQVGAQSNPVGHSGLLGLKGVDNRLEGIIAEFELKKVNFKNWISTKAELDQEWVPDGKENLIRYISTNLSKSGSTSYSTMILAQEMKLKTMDDMKDMEKARFLPRVGLFANSQFYSGRRDTANSQTYGLYLMWDLFNSDSYGRVSEAEAKAMTQQMKLLAYKQEEKIALQQLADSKQTLERTLVLLDDSEKLLKEQTVNAMKLFRSGMLSALQLAEVINRRVDLIENKTKAESQFLEVTSRLYQINN